MDRRHFLSMSTTTVRRTQRENTRQHNKQIVMYPIMNLRRYRQDIHWYLRALEETVIRTLAKLGLKGERIEGLTGVWVDGHKVAVRERGELEAGWERGGSCEAHDSAFPSARFQNLRTRTRHFGTSGAATGLERRGGSVGMGGRLATWVAFALVIGDW